jgi:hypothetical protein
MFRKSVPSDVQPMSIAGIKTIHAVSTDAVWADVKIIG